MAAIQATTVATGARQCFQCRSSRNYLTSKRCLRIGAEPEKSPGVETASGKAAEEEVPVWERREQDRKLKEESKDLPFGLYLLLSSFVAIAAVGSVFEFFNQNSIFGVIEPSSPLYLPILGIFAITGLPSAGWLFIKAVTVANEDAERMDKADGM